MNVYVVLIDDFDSGIFGSVHATLPGAMSAAAAKDGRLINTVWTKMDGDGERASWWQASDLEYYIEEHTLGE